MRHNKAPHGHHLEVNYPPPGTLPIDIDRANVLTTISGSMTQDWVFDEVRLKEDALFIRHIAALDPDTAQVTCTDGDNCKLAADAWSIGQSGLAFTYAVKDQSISLFDTLTDDSTFCFLSGIQGYPGEDDDFALTTGHSDGLWHVEQSGALFGYATCLPYDQGW